jgi:hypothetical protein
MRALLEFLGILAPGRGRREPVVLPAWTRGFGLLLVAGLAIVSTLVSVLVRALVG